MNKERNKRRGQDLEDVAELKKFAEQFDRQVVVCFAVHRNGNAFTITTYGENKKLCKLAENFGDQIFEAVNSGQITSPDVEPSTEPCSRKTYIRAEENNDE